MGLIKPLIVFDFHEPLGPELGLDVKVELGTLDCNLT